MEDTKLPQTKFSEQINTNVDSVGKSVEEVVTINSEHEESAQSAQSVEVQAEQQVVQPLDENSAASQ